MPVRWSDRMEEAPASPGAFTLDGGRPVATVTLWPYRSMPPTGFAGVIGFTGAMFLIPLLPALGTPVFWGLLPFILIALAGLYILIRRNYRDAELVEVLTIHTDHVKLVRSNPRTSEQNWEANPHWIRLTLHRGGGPVENYLTMSGGSREVEIGAFLTPEERVSLHGDLERLLNRLPI